MLLVMLLVMALVVTPRCAQCPRSVLLHSRTPCTLALTHSVAQFLPQSFWWLSIEGCCRSLTGMMARAVMATLVVCRLCSGGFFSLLPLVFFY